MIANIRGTLNAKLGKPRAKRFIDGLYKGVGTSCIWVGRLKRERVHVLVERYF